MKAERLVYVLNNRSVQVQFTDSIVVHIPNPHRRRVMRRKDHCPRQPTICSPLAEKPKLFLHSFFLLFFLCPVGVNLLFFHKLLPFPVGQVVRTSHIHGEALRKNELFMYFMSFTVRATPISSIRTAELVLHISK